jgi:hypothetical protein
LIPSTSPRVRRNLVGGPWHDAPRCGEDNPARARFCLACGAPLAPAGEPREVRKTVTVVFSDLVGSTPLGERLDPEALREVVTRYYDRTAEVLTRHGGTMAKFIGDAVMAVYGIPRLHEDDALRAVRAAGELGRALEELNAELETALGVRLLGVRPDAAGHARHLDAPMVSRDRELGLLAGGLERAVGERRGLLTVVLGPAGVGKSRLVQEFVATVRGRATVLRGRCLEYGEGLNYWPVAEVVRDAVASGGPEAPGGRPAGLRGLLAGTEHAAYVAEALAGIEGAAGRTASGEDVPWAVARLFEALARRRPLVVVLDDLHWAELTLLDLVEQVVGAVHGAPLLLVGTARPELLDDRPWWGAAAPDVLPVVLEPLGVEACGRLVANLLGGAALPGEVARAIAEAAGGNPLFVEELVAELLDRGVLTRTGGRWTATADLAHVPVPATISALLAARLEPRPVSSAAGHIEGPSRCIRQAGTGAHSMPNWRGARGWGSGRCQKEGHRAFTDRSDHPRHRPARGRGRL